MERFRYAIALLGLMSMPLVVAYWMTIHPFIRVWRRLGPKVAYSAVAVVLIIVGAGAFALRFRLLGANLGTNGLLIGLGALCLAVSTALGLQVHRQFALRTLAGMPEIQPGASDGLITGGVYSRVRHPRYLGLLLGLLGWTLIANYRGLHVMFAVFLPALYGVILLEEKELRERFGDDYRAYCKRVPGLIPRRL